MIRLKNLLLPAASLLCLGTLGANVDAADWLKILGNPPAGANTVVLVNADSLRQGAVKLKQYKDGEQAEPAMQLVDDFPENIQRVAVAAHLDLESLESVWEAGAGTFSKHIDTPRVIAEREGGYVDQLAGKPAIWSPRRRYLIPLGADRMGLYIPANRSAANRWVRGLSQAAVALPDYLQRTAERALDGTPVLVAVDMADVVSPVQAVEKVESLNSVKAAKLQPEAVGKLLGDLRGLTFTVTLKDHYIGELRLEFGVAPTLIKDAGREMIVELCSRRGLLLPEFREWTASVDGKAFVLSGSLDAISVVNLLAVFRGSPQPGDSSADSSAPPPESSANNQQAEMGKASKKYFAGVQRILKESRNTKGLSPAERGVFNDKLSRKIDDLPLLNVDPDLLDYASNVSQLLRGAGYVIRSANVAAGGQKATQASSSVSYGGWGYGGGWSFNDNTAYNESLTRQAHAEGMQAHLTNMQQVDTLTSQIRRQMTERYQIEF